MAGLRLGLSRIAEKTAEWAGIPMPLDGERLVVERSYPFAEMLAGLGRTPTQDSDDEWTHVNEWYSASRRCKIIVMRNRNGRASHGKIAAFHHISYDLSTLACSDAWGLEQEHRALQLLGTMVRHRQMKQYILTGMFMETSRRSGLAYIFRRLKPTVVLAPSCRSDDSQPLRILAALCMHPIAYYAGSWAGGMCPTDDVIAHLSLMRGDEHMFWRRANQHPPHLPEAGL